MVKQHLQKVLMRIFTPNSARVQSCSRSILRKNLPNVTPTPNSARVQTCSCAHAHALLCTRAIMPTLMLTLNPAHGETYRASRIRPTLRACKHAHARMLTPYSVCVQSCPLSCSGPTLRACNHAHALAHAQSCAWGNLPSTTHTPNSARVQSCTRACSRPTLCACKRHQPQRSAAHSRHCRPMFVYYDFLPWFPMLPFVLFWQWQRLLLCCALRARARVKRRPSALPPFPPLLLSAVASCAAPPPTCLTGISASVLLLQSAP